MTNDLLSLCAFLFSGFAAELDLDLVPDLSNPRVLVTHLGPHTHTLSTPQAHPLEAPAAQQVTVGVNGSSGQAGEGVSTGADEGGATNVTGAPHLSAVVNAAAAAAAAAAGEHGSSAGAGTRFLFLLKQRAS